MCASLRLTELICEVNAFLSSSLYEWLIFAFEPATDTLPPFEGKTAEEACVLIFVTS
jgi:hypothetical protein